MYVTESILLLHLRVLCCSAEERLCSMNQTTAAIPFSRFMFILGKDFRSMEHLEKRLGSYVPLWGRFIPETRIYRSRNCCVYTLSNGSLNQSVSYVVKIITILGQGEELEQRTTEVRQEIAAMEQLRDCATVVTLYDDAWMPLYEADELIGWDVLLRMEQLECVAELLREGELLSVAEIRTLACDISMALADAHQLGMIHRDVKPANLYRTAQGRFQLGDFGVAQHSRTGVLETMIGTAAYMAPEVARGEFYDNRVDLYSLGIVLYQLLNDGQLPLTDENTPFPQREAAVHRRWKLSKLPPPRHGDRNFKRIVLRCCANRPQKRFASADALVRALQPPKRRWKLAAVTGLICVLLTTAMLALPQAESVEEAQREPSESQTVEAVPKPERRYAVIKGVMTWEDARLYCESRGGQLAAILDQKQMDTITALLEEKQIETVWLGAHNYSSNNGYQWLSGEPFEFAAWAMGEPNNQAGEEHYLMMYWKEDQGWVWNDSTLDGMKKFAYETCGFVCQWED